MTFFSPRSSLHFSNFILAYKLTLLRTHCRRSMEDWNELWSFEDIQAVQIAATKTLKNCGISLPRGSEKIAASSRSQGSAASFGVSLRSGRQPTVTYKYGDHGRFKVPR